MVNKGKVSALHDGGKLAAVTRYTGEIVTAGLVVPWYLIGALSVGDPVIYSLFDDNTGIILHRADGDGVGGFSVSAKVVDGVLVVAAESAAASCNSGNGVNTTFTTDDTFI